MKFFNTLTEYANGIAEKNYYETYRLKIRLTRILLGEICFLSYTVLDMSLKFSSSYSFVFIFIIMLATISVSVSPIFLSDGAKANEDTVLNRIKPYQIISLVVFGALTIASDLSLMFVKNPVLYNTLCHTVLLMLILFSFFHLLIYSLLTEKLGFLPVLSFVLFSIAFSFFAAGMFEMSVFALSLVYLINAFITARNV